MPSAIPSSSSFLLVLKWLCFYEFGFLPKLQVPSESYFWPLPEEMWKSAFPILLYKHQWENVNELNTLWDFFTRKISHILSVWLVFLKTFPVYTGVTTCKKKLPKVLVLKTNIYRVLCCQQKTKAFMATQEKNLQNLDMDIPHRKCGMEYKLRS